MKKTKFRQKVAGAILRPTSSRKTAARAIARLIILADNLKYDEADLAKMKQHVSRDPKSYADIYEKMKTMKQLDPRADKFWRAVQEHVNKLLGSQVGSGNLKSTILQQLLKNYDQSKAREASHIIESELQQNPGSAFALAGLFSDGAKSVRAALEMTMLSPVKFFKDLEALDFNLESLLKQYS